MYDCLHCWRGTPILANISWIYDQLTEESSKPGASKCLEFSRLKASRQDMSSSTLPRKVTNGYRHYWLRELFSYRYMKNRYSSPEQMWPVSAPVTTTSSLPEPTVYFCPLDPSGSSLCSRWLQVRGPTNLDFVANCIVEEFSDPISLKLVSHTYDYETTIFGIQKPNIAAQRISGVQDLLRFLTRFINMTAVGAA